MSRKAASSREAKGLVCHRCGCAHLRVVYTRRGSDRKLIRRRECRYCGRRITTYEQTGG
jgi:transcriptional regulator NrdR family protein